MKSATRIPRECFVVPADLDGLFPATEDGMLTTRAFLVEDALSARSSNVRIAGAGPMPMISGGTPTAAADG
jgi:hypothetical protein